MKWQIPLSDLDFDAQELEAANKILQSRWLSMGCVTRRFEEEFAAYLDAKYAVAVSSGTAALHLALLALEIGPGDEVIVPSLSFVATANAVSYTGATPIFADIISDTELVISPTSIEANITAATKAVVVMHYGGYACPMEEIMSIAREHSLAVIEDAAHAPGATFGNRKLGTIGDFGCFSFFSNKNLSTGEGGMVVTDRSELADRIRLLRSHGMTTLSWDRHQVHSVPYDVVQLGYNYRFDDLRAGLGIVQLGKLDRNNRRRREIADWYRCQLRDMAEIGLPFLQHPGLSAAHLFPVVLGDSIDRGMLMAAMADSGVQTSIHYPPIHKFCHYRDANMARSIDLAVTERVATRLVTLPLFPRMSQHDVEMVVEAVRHGTGGGVSAGGDSRSASRSPTVVSR